jgi:NADH:ubiquinone oxidoreductase subunit F (NADH-binding)/(2Fe-2S) ferredoxin/NAD-dependent dihydropyrimidine dehydrogenase PreA subunit
MHDICVCQGTGCPTGPQLAQALEVAINQASLQHLMQVKPVGCPGLCEMGPIVIVQPGDTFYRLVQPEDARAIVEAVAGGHTIERLLLQDEDGTSLAQWDDVPFYRKQTRQVLALCGRINPKKIQDYINYRGYNGLQKALTQMTPEVVVDEIRRSGLRGRGGAGFPTGIKWDFCRKAPGDIKYLICNGDEGDPGAFMDRSILEANPHSVLEGILIAAYAIGASEGYLYIRAEYPLAIQNIQIAIRQAEERGFLGSNILGTGFIFHAQVKEGAGAFVCGEETALIASIEGKRGMPRPRPPFPAQKGLFGRPTVINNVETLANIPIILEKGADRYSAIGTDKSKGTKVFALTGKVRNTGLVEVPMGTTLREVIFDIGGGIPDDLQFKAAQTGGPSGGCLPANLLDLPIDYDSLAQAGAIMGSGGLVVMDENTCMVDVARFFLSFTQSESCGKCVPCRLGTKHMLDLLTEITEGNGTDAHLVLLRELAVSIKSSSLCALGQTAPNPVLTTLQYFLDEYEAHIHQKRCPAGVCRALVAYDILTDKCTGCGLCLRACPAEAITGERRKTHSIDQDKCIQCGACHEVCRFDAVVVGSKQQMHQRTVDSVGQ